MSRESSMTEVLTKLADAKQRIESFADLPDGWDTYGAPTPTRQAIDNAKATVDELARHGIEPDSISPYGEGIEFEFRDSQSRWGLFDLLNDGSVSLYFERRDAMLGAIKPPPDRDASANEIGDMVANVAEWMK